MPTYFALATLNLGLVTVYRPRRRARRILRDTGLPSLPLELLSGLMAGATVLVWAACRPDRRRSAALVLVITIPLVRSVGDALMRGDDLAVLRHVSDSAPPRWRDCRATASGSSRRCWTQSSANGHGSQSRSTTARCSDWSRSARTQPRRTTTMARRLDKAIAETRAIISSFHPASVRELGFEASLRAAVAPFPAAESVEPDDRERDRRPRRWRTRCWFPIAQELVVNAVKHARPTAIRVLVRVKDGQIVLDVDDDGVGIDDAASRRAVQAGHLGLAMVRRRVEDVGGSLEIATRADGGTHSRVILPAAARLTGRTSEAARSANGPGLNVRSHSLDACSITSWTLPAYLASRPRKRALRNAVAAAIGGEGGKHGLAQSKFAPICSSLETSAYRRSFSLTPDIGILTQRLDRTSVEELYAAAARGRA